MASVLYQSIETLSRDKGIEPEIVVGAVEDAIALATRKYYKTQENMRAEMDRETGEIRAYVFKTVVETPEQIEDDINQMSLEQAREHDLVATLGLADDFGEEPFLRSEVVDEHAVAGAEGSRDVAEREVAESTFGQVVDGSGEELLASGRWGAGRCAGFRAGHEPHGTCTVWFT